jgi:hypothetical protein
MANELYRTQVQVNLGWKYSQLTFFWIVNNLAGESAYYVANSINAQIITDSLWLYSLAGCIAEQCRVLRVSTKRIDPLGGAARHDSFLVGSVPGRLVGDCQQSWCAARLGWHTANDRTGKLGVRLGPLPAGMFQETGWYPIFTVAVELFVIQHLLPRTTLSGTDFQAAARFGDGTAEKIDFGILGWPHSRQINRRMPF